MTTPKIDQDMVQEMRKDLPAMLADLKAKKQVDSNRLLCAILVTVLGNDTTLYENQKRITSLEQRVKKLEVETYQNKAIFKNVPLHDSVRGRNANETVAQTLEVMEEIFDVVGADKRTLHVARRIPLPKNKPRFSTNTLTYPVIQVTFGSFNERMEFLAKISKIRDSEKYGKVSMDPDIPPILRDEFKMASRKAYELRRKHIKTRIIVSYAKAEIIILKKNAKDTVFTQFPRDNWFNEDEPEN